MKQQCIIQFKKARGRPRKIKPKQKLQCRFCSLFLNADNRNLKEKKRYCPVVDGYITENHTACESIELNKYFWCDKECNFIDIEACIARQDRKQSGCNRCKTGRLIKERSS